MQTLRAAALSILGFLYFVAGFSFVMADNGANDRLDFGDRVTVTVYGQPEVSGVFQVNGEGNIELPIVGAVSIGQSTISEAQERIKERLSNGYILHPAVTVTITERRPIYVVGDVKSPGTFPFRHGSTVLNAVAQAGGYGTSGQPVAAAALADYLASDERVQALETSRFILSTRKARLEAQLEGKDDFLQPPMPILDVQTEQLDIVVANERDALRRQLQATKEQVQLLEGQKPRLAAAVDAVNEQIESQRRQMKLVATQLEDWQRMKEKGLALRVTEVSLLREQASIDILISGFRTELARLSMQMGEIDLKIHEAKSSTHQRIAGELQDVRTRLSELETSLPAARRVREVRLQQSDGAAGLDALQVSHRVIIRRTIKGAVQAVRADEQTPLEPGDIVEVIRVSPTSHQLSRLGRVDRRVQAHLDDQILAGSSE
jgi:polysaccharide export outer membrane protein